MESKAAFKVKAFNRKHIDFASIEDPGAAKWVKPFYFIQAADCQFGLIDRYIKQLDNPGWSEETELSERLVEICNKMQPKPKFLVICGDLVDAYPSQPRQEEQTAEFKRIYAKLDPSIPLVCVCGNHDLGEEPDSSAIELFRSNFGDDYFHFVIEGVLFIVINTQLYMNRQHVEEYARNQDIWLEDMLSKCQSFKYSIVFEHIPWFLKDQNEDNEYFNIDKDVRAIWLDKFRRAGVTKIMCGHYHRNAGGWISPDLELVVTSAIGASLGDDKSGARVVKLLDDGVEHEYFAMDDLPSRVSI